MQTNAIVKNESTTSVMARTGKENDMEQTGVTKSKKLYHVTSWPRCFPHAGGYYEDVGIRWFACRNRGDEPPAPYTEAILNYSRPTASRKGRSSAEALVSQLFTEKEAKSLKAYLWAAHHDRAYIGEVRLPTNPNMWNAARTSLLGGPAGCYVLHAEAHYDLDFQVEGLFSVLDCERTTAEIWDPSLIRVNASASILGRKGPQVNARDLVLGYMNAIKPPCVLCGEPCELHTPFAAFVRDTHQPVCDKCVRERSPGLHFLLHLHSTIKQGSSC